MIVALCKVSLAGSLETELLMRKKKPHIASMDEVNLTREDGVAIIEYKDSTVATTHFNIGPRIKAMTDEEILDMFNESLRIQKKMADEYVHVAIEIPPGRPQIKRCEATGTWFPRGEVLRCIVSDGGPDGEATVCIDDQELSLVEFGELLICYAGWGMRMVFVPDDEIEERAATDVRDVEDDPW